VLINIFFCFFNHIVPSGVFLFGGLKAWMVPIVLDTLHCLKNSIDNYRASDRFDQISLYIQLNGRFGIGKQFKGADNDKTGMGYNMPYTEEKVKPVAPALSSEVCN